jgi:hypothetical protein
MKLVSRLAAIALAVAVAFPAVAQERARAGRFGLGVGISDGDLFDTLVFVPMNFNNLRIEPFIGVDRADTDIGGETSDFTLGVGAFFVQPIATPVQMYVGGRLGLNWESSKEAGPTPDKTERRDTILAAVLGGEYLVSPRFAVGAEAMLAYVAVGDTEFTPFGGPTVEADGGSAVRTQGTIFARVYLF